MDKINNKKHIAWRVLAGFAFAVMTMVALSCSDELVETSNKELAQDSEFFVIDNSSSATRVDYDNYNHSTFEEGDLVGVYLLEKEGGSLKSVNSETFENVPYKVTTTKNIVTQTTQQVLKPAGDKKIPQADGYTYVFVYPYVENQTYSDLVNLTHAVETDQSSTENFEKSDLLWDVKTASNNSVHVTMHHAMAQIIVEVDEKYIDEKATVRLTSKPNTKVEKLNLSSIADAYSAAEVSEDQEVSMWDFGYSESGSRLFRAVIPAQSNISQSSFLSFQKDGKDKVYNLQESLTVEAGKNYIFVIRKNTIQPEINDDDSWVLDVLDPETGEPVGLLCREYIRYQPESIDKLNPQGNDTIFDIKTGTPNDYNSKWITSQAWVFYKLKDFTTRIPNLDEGTVLRFIYDFEKPTFPWWPYEDGHNYMQWGVFAPVHGAHWCSPGDKNKSGQEQGHEVYDENGKPKIEEYWMHGGTIYWDGNNNKIKSFTMPTDNITCAVALEKGHIAINGQNVYVSYKDYENDEVASGIKRGVIVPHCLIDRRISQTGVLEINKYPLVKIGYNQFWMSKSLNAKTMTDGTPLTCYNKQGSPGVTFSNTTTDDMTAGYIYPYVSNVEDGNNGNVDYDPFNNSDQMAVHGNFKPLPLYNSLCLMNEKFLPKATDSRLNYIIPTTKQIEDMEKYFGIWFAAKLMSRYVTPKMNPNQDQSFAYSSLQSILKGESRGGNIGSISQNPINAYTANVSGFNCRALGYYCPDMPTSFTDITGTDLIQLKPNNRLHLSHLIFHVYDAWGKNKNIVDEQYNQYRLPPSKWFGQVRFVMKFKNQADTSGSRSATTRAESTSTATTKSVSNNVYIQLKEK